METAKVQFLDRRERAFVTRDIEVDDIYGSVARLVNAPEIVRPDSPRPLPTETQELADCTGCGKLKLDAKALASGAKALSKIKFGKDKAADEVVAARIAVCVSCPSKCHDGFGVCDLDKGGCGCLLPIKVRIASESCPHNHWPAQGD